jgi:type I restriction enzyme S subunit
MKAMQPRTEISELIRSGAIIEIQDGNHGEKHPKGTEYVETGIPFIMANDVADNYIDVEQAYKIPPSLADQLRIGFSLNGDVLLTHKGTIGRTAIVDGADPYWMLTPQVTYYRTNPEKLDSYFLMCAFREDTFQRTLKSLADQATRPYIGITAQKKLKIAYKPIALQRKIVAALRPYDELIRNNRSRIEILEQAVRTLYEEWFVRFRYPGHKKHAVRGSLPSGWRKDAALNVLDVLGGGTPKTGVPRYWDGDIPFYTPKDAVSGVWVHGAERSVSAAGLSNCSSPLYPKGTVFITARGTVGKLNLAAQPMAMSQSCYALVGKEGLSNPFVYCSIKFSIAHLKQQAGGAIFDAIVTDTFTRLCCPTSPPPPS